MSVRRDGGPPDAPRGTERRGCRRWDGGRTSAAGKGRAAPCRLDGGTLRRGRSGQGRRRSGEGVGGSGPRRPPATQNVGGEDDLGCGAEGESGAAV